MKTRRDFLQSFAATAALAALSNRKPLWGESAEPARPVRAWMTAGARRYMEVEAPLHWQKASAATGLDIRIDPTVRKQSILGFGGAFTDASCFLFSQLPPDKRQQLLNDLFGVEGLRLSVGRTCIGSSDYSRSVFSYDDTSKPDPDLTHFSIEHDRAYILPSLRAAEAVNPEMFLLASPWSPPGWMKASGTMLGGSMQKTYFSTYAQYFVRFIQAYSAAGVKIGAVTVQNEPDTGQDGKMPACLWGQEYETGFIESFLGPALERASLDTKIWVLDHNYDLWGRVLDELSDPGVSKYVDGVAWHGYVGNVDAMTRVHDAFPEKNAYWTEGGPDYDSPDYTTDWSTWAQTFSGILRNWGRCAIGWNLALDEQGKPNIGPFKCGGIVTIDSKTQNITRSGQYWAFAHFSKAIRRNARVLASAGNFKDVEHVAIENPDGGRVLVITNRGGARTLNCGLGSSALKVAMPRNSVATLVW